MTTKSKDSFAGIEDLGDSIKVSNEAQWQYESMGYNATSGIIYVGDEKVKEVTLVPMALRQCKEVELDNGSVRRFSIYAKKETMPSGKVSQRAQMVCLVNGELHTFGAKSWTARAFLLNPESGRYHDENYQAGLWVSLSAIIADIKKAKGVQTAPFCFSVDVSTGKKFKNKVSGGEMVPMAWGDPVFVGKDAAIANQELYDSEDLESWVAEWHSTKGEQVEAEEYIQDGAIGTEEDNIEDIPGFDI